MDSNYWDTPHKQNVGLFTDLGLFTDALDAAMFYTTFTKKQLREELSNRVKGIIFIEALKQRTINHLIREMIDYEWISIDTPGKETRYKLTEEGRKAIELFKADKEKYFEFLILTMNKIYSIPGWFVNRLWDLNPDGQGEIVIPAPPKGWNPRSRQWEDKEWDNELSGQVSNSLNIIKKVSEGAFPIPEKTWIDEVRKSWDRLSNVKRRNAAGSSAEQENKKHERTKPFAPRSRLFNAMKEAAVKLLFGNINPKTKKTDFEVDNVPLSTRHYMVWCPRLAALEMIFYTDFHPRIPGRLIFPVSVFKKGSQYRSFKKINGIVNPAGELLFLHHPGWEFLNNFTGILYVEHQRAYSKIKSLYVSIMDVRDEVCRMLRLSANHFDKFLEQAMKKTLNDNSEYSISIESDVREDQGSGYQMLRRPVVIAGKPYSLIAMTKLKNDRKEVFHEQFTAQT